MINPNQYLLIIYENVRYEFNAYYPIKSVTYLAQKKRKGKEITILNMNLVLNATVIFLWLFISLFSIYISSFHTLSSSSSLSFFWFIGG